MNRPSLKVFSYLRLNIIEKVGNKQLMLTAEIASIRLSGNYFLFLDGVQPAYWHQYTFIKNPIHADCQA